MDRPKCDTATGQAEYLLFLCVGSFEGKMESMCENCHLNYSFLCLQLGERSVCYNVFVLAKLRVFFKSQGNVLWF